MDDFLRARAARIFAEHQRLDRHRDGERRHPHLAEIDVIEIHQHHAVDDEDFALDAKFFPQERPEGLGDVAVEHDVDRQLGVDLVRKAFADALPECEYALVRRRAGPAQRQRDLGIGFRHLERLAVGDDRLGERLGVDLFADFIRRRHDLKVAARQQLAGGRDIAGVAAQLDAVFGRAERGGANAFARRQERPGQKLAGVHLAADGLAEALAHVAEVLFFAIVDIFGDAAGEHDAAEIAEVEDRIGQIQMLDVMRQRPRLERRDQRVGHHVGDLVELFGSDDVAELPVEAGAARVSLAGRVEADDPHVLVDHLQAAADVDGGGDHHLAALDQTELGGAAADVDVEDAHLAFERGGGRAGAVGGQHGFHVMAGGGADEVAGGGRQHA